MSLAAFALVRTVDDPGPLRRALPTGARLLACGGLGLLIGDSPDDPAESLRLHARVLDRASSVATVLPVRAGARFVDDADARAAIERNRPLWERWLEAVDGCEEWVLRVELPAPTDHSAAASPTPNAPPRADSPGVAYLTSLRTRYAPDDELHPSHERDLTRLGAALTPPARAIRIEGTSGRSTRPAVLCLTPRHAREGLRRALDAADTPGPVTMYGPFPPASFAGTLTPPRP